MSRLSPSVLSALPHLRSRGTSLAPAFHAEGAHGAEHRGGTHVTGIADAVVTDTAAFTGQLARSRPVGDHLGEMRDTSAISSGTLTPRRDRGQGVSQCIPQKHPVQTAIGPGTGERPAMRCL